MRNRLLSVFLLFILALGFADTSSAMPQADYSKPSVRDWISGRTFGSSSGFALLDPSKLTVNHSLSMGSSLSGGQSMFQSLYMSNFSYKLSDPLTLGFVLGMQNLKFNNVPGLNTYNSFVGGVSLDYRPSNNFRFYAAMNFLPDNAMSNFGYSKYNSMFGSMYSDRYMQMLDHNPDD